MRSILLHVGNDDCFEARLQASLGLAREYDGHLARIHPSRLAAALPGQPACVDSARELDLGALAEHPLVTSRHRARIVGPGLYRGMARKGVGPWSTR